MVDAIVSFAIQTLGNFLIQQVNIRIGVRDTVRWLKDELVFLQASVRYAESRQDEELIRNWLNNVREVADEAVAILRNFNVLHQEHASSKQDVCHSLISYVWMCKKESKLYDIGRDFESLKERVVDIKKRRREYGINAMLATPNVQQKRRALLRTTAIDNHVDVVGFEDDIKTLMSELDSEDPWRKVIAIHGMGGLGKTSLATELYNSGDLRHFGTRAKVCVSNEYSIKDVLKRLIKSFMGIEHEQELSKMDEHDLLHHLQKLLQDRGRYLIVIDDIWDTKVWELIIKAFPDQKNGSRIIITTRNKKVAEMIDDKCFVHQLRFLTEEESWQLFCKRAEPTQNLKKLGKEMVGKCGGLPLVIVVLSGLLLHNKNYAYWSKVKEHIWRHLKGGASVQIEEILSLSYIDLSLQMQDCFLYLARFPEDHIIDVHVLKLQWIAEEFISEDHERDGVPMEELAEDYLFELINRNLIQITRLQWDGNVGECRVHDLVRELAIDKAKEQKFLGIFDSSRQHPKPIQLLRGHRRHAIYNGIGEYFKLFERRSDALNVHSLSLNNLSGRVQLEEMKMCTKFKNLQVLDLTRVKSDRIPEEVGDLVLLKFIGLMGCFRNSLEIPPSIVKLKRLQTLCGSNFFQCYTIPRELWELKELRHITNGQYNGSMNICNHQTKLRTLDEIRYKDWVQIDTLTIPNLQTLTIIRSEELGRGYAYTLDSIAKLASLQTFTLLLFSSTIPTIKPLWSCKLLKSVYLAGTIEDPLELNFLPDSVRNLSLIRSGFFQDPMPTLGNFTNLTALELFDVYRGKKMVCNHNAFPSLQVLRLERMDNLEEWQVEDQTLPSLISFKTTRCDYLKTLPAQLERLRIMGTSDLNNT
ncbi:hypothetical protein ACET3Z_026893 [Daucus carota]